MVNRLTARRPEKSIFRREADKWRPSRAEVEKAWGLTSTPLRVQGVMCLIKRGDNFMCL
jgi:hypothetical protein